MPEPAVVTKFVNVSGTFALSVPDGMIRPWFGVSVDMT
jgi:hypothetical protein